MDYDLIKTIVTTRIQNAERDIIMKLNSEQKAIIEHTIKNGIYCGSSKDMDILCEAGLMEFAGRKPFVPDTYYRVTRLGKEAVHSKLDSKGN